MNGLIGDTYNNWKLEDQIQRERNQKRLKQRLQSAKPILQTHLDPPTQQLRRHKTKKPEKSIQQSRQTSHVASGYMGVQNYPEQIEEIQERSVISSHTIMASQKSGKTFKSQLTCNTQNTTLGQQSTNQRKLRKHEVFRQIEVQNQNEHLLKSLLSIANRKNLYNEKPHPHITQMTGRNSQNSVNRAGTISKGQASKQPQLVKQPTPNLDPAFANYLQAQEKLTNASNSRSLSFLKNQVEGINRNAPFANQLSHDGPYAQPEESQYSALTPSDSLLKNLGQFKKNALMGSHASSQFQPTTQFTQNGPLNEEYKMRTMESTTAQKRKLGQVTSRSFQKLSQQRSIEKENVRMFKMIQNADSSVKKALDLKTHKMKIKAFLNKGSTFKRALNAETKAKKIVWTGVYANSTRVGNNSRSLKGGNSSSQLRGGLSKYSGGLASNPSNPSIAMQQHQIEGTASALVPDRPQALIGLDPPHTVGTDSQQVIYQESVGEPEPMQSRTRPLRQIHSVKIQKSSSKSKKKKGSAQYIESAYLPPGSRGMNLMNLLNNNANQSPLKKGPVLQADPYFQEAAGTQQLRSFRVPNSTDWVPQQPQNDKPLSQSYQQHQNVPDGSQSDLHWQQVQQDLAPPAHPVMSSQVNSQAEIAERLQGLDQPIMASDRNFYMSPSTQIFKLQGGRKGRAQSTKRRHSRGRHYASHNSKKAPSSLRGYTKMTQNQGRLTNIQVSGVLSHTRSKAGNLVGASGDYSQGTDLVGFVNTSNQSNPFDVMAMPQPRRGKSSTRPSTQNSSAANNVFGAKHNILPQFTNNYAIRRKKLKSQIKEIMKECDKVDFKLSQEIYNIEVNPEGHAGMSIQMEAEEEEEYSERFNQ